MMVNFILYVTDQAASARFYAAVLALPPALDVPGMTEFRLGEGATLGLMPVSGIRRLLGPSLPDHHRLSLAFLWGGLRSCLFRRFTDGSLRVLVRVILLDKSPGSRISINTLSFRHECLLCRVVGTS